MARLVLQLVLIAVFSGLSFTVLPPGYHFCKLQLHPGNCKGRFRVWGYVPKRDACLSFLYYGCNGNANRFATKKDCISVCIKGQVLDDSKSEPALIDYDNPDENHEMEGLNMQEY